MKILHVHEFYGRAGGGGSEQSIPNLCALLEARGNRTAVVFGTDTGQQDRPPGRPLHHIPRVGLARPLPSWWRIRRMVDILEREDPDVVHLHQVHDCYLVSAIVRRKPTLLFMHNHTGICVSGTVYLRRSARVCPRRGGPGCAYFAFVEGCNSIRLRTLADTFVRFYSTRRILRLVDAVGVDSQYVAETLRAEGLGDRPIYVTPTITEFAVPDPPDAASAEPVVLFVGRLAPEKGIQCLLEALRFVKSPCQALVVGDGQERGRAVARLVRLGLGERVHFEGWVQKDALPRYYQRAAVVVVPSVWPEPLGLVGPEAMAHGRPVVAFSSGGIPEWLVDGETGFLVAPGDVVALGARIEQLLRDPALRGRMGRRGWERIQGSLSPTRHVDTVVEIYHDVIRRRSPQWEGELALPGRL